jgi:hypothetical protein
MKESNHDHLHHTKSNTHRIIGPILSLHQHKVLEPSQLLDRQNISILQFISTATALIV